MHDIESDNIRHNTIAKQDLFKYDIYNLSIHPFILSGMHGSIPIFILCIFAFFST